jgi:hypothetical protein
MGTGLCYFFETSDYAAPTGLTCHCRGRGAAIGAG